jgi:hypothetical protein
MNKLSMTMARPGETLVAILWPKLRRGVELVGILDRSESLGRRSAKSMTTTSLEEATATFSHVDALQKRCRRSQQRNIALFVLIAEDCYRLASDGLVRHVPFRR